VRGALLIGWCGQPGGQPYLLEADVWAEKCNARLKGRWQKPEDGTPILTAVGLQRIVRLGGAVDDDMANLIVAQLLTLDSTDKKKDITMYVNSPGGSVTAGTAPSTPQLGSSSGNKGLGLRVKNPTLQLGSSSGNKGLGLRVKNPTLQLGSSSGNKGLGLRVKNPTLQLGSSSGNKGLGLRVKNPTLQFWVQLWQQGAAREELQADDLP